MNLTRPRNQDAKIWGNKTIILYKTNYVEISKNQQRTDLLV